jgi:fluoroacetyl-CoA thioesterase
MSDIDRPMDESPSRIVTAQDTAAALGSGDVSVLGTPRLIAWLEAATVEVAKDFLDPSQTTVGTAVRIDHRRATPVGGRVHVTVSPGIDQVGRRLTFTLRATDESGQLVADGQIDRVIVDRQRFHAANTESRDPG